MLLLPRGAHYQLYFCYALPTSFHFRHSETELQYFIKSYLTSVFVLTLIFSVPSPSFQGLRACKAKGSKESLS